jgi:SAM-dependent methyltransferase
MAGTQEIRIDRSNAEQLQAWDGDEGAYWAAHAERFERSLSRYDESIFAAAAIGRDAHVLDIGCGTGSTTREAGRRASAGSVLGVDLSSAMIEVARRIAEREGAHNVRFEQADAQVHPFADQAFDVALSRTGAMFFGDPVAAFANIGRAMRPAGRLVLLVWQPMARNEWIVEIMTALAAGRDMPTPPPDAPGQFSLSDPARVRSLLSAGGFVDVDVKDVRERVYFGPDPEDASRFIRGLLAWMLEGLDETGRARARDALRDRMHAHNTPEGVLLDSAAWLVTAARQ